MAGMNIGRLSLAYYFAATLWGPSSEKFALENRAYGGQVLVLIGYGKLSI